MTWRGFPAWRSPPCPAGARGPVWVKATNGHEATFDAVLFATGRRPATAGLGLEPLGVQIGRRGEIVVDRYQPDRRAVDLCHRRRD